MKSTVTLATLDEQQYRPITEPKHNVSGSGDNDNVEYVARAKGRKSPDQNTLTTSLEW